ncbi:MAG: PD-(D/E)XK nuclease family protein, partial [Acidobacteriota bacterium]|nr:PD-(D/E)XK nuclease family protein [Acidobacteriota bacterium]
VEESGRVPLRKLVENTWLLLGGPAVLRGTHEVEDVKAFLSLLESMEDGGIISDFSQLNVRLACLFAKSAPAANSVQVMTVYKAKGLEFDTVILPKLEGTTQGPERDLLIWDETVHDDGSVDLRVAAQPRKGEKSQTYDAIRASHRTKNEGELKRLLYVACTRARNSLYLVGNVKTKTDGSLERPRSGSFLRVLWTTAGSEFQGVLRRSVRQLPLHFAETEGLSAKSPASTTLRHLPANWQLPRFSRWAEWKPSLGESTPSTRKVTYEWVGDTGRHVGTVVHDLIKRATTDSAEWNAERLEIMQPAIRSELLRLGVPQSERSAASARVTRALQNMLASERGRWLLASHADSQSEWPLGGKIGGQIVSGTVDRIFRDDEGRLWIVDFKTSEHEGGHLERFLDEEQRRYRSQLESYGALIARMKKGPVWLALYFPLLDAWREWQYEESAVRLAT